jgi:hypothetical protein
VTFHAHQQLDNADIPFKTRTISGEHVATNELLWQEIALSVQSGLGSWDTGWIDARPYSVLWLGVKWPAVAATVGALVLEGALDPVKDAHAIYDVTASITKYFVVGGTVWPAVSAVLGSYALPITDPFPYMRLKYTFGAGGALSQFTPFAFGRGS